MEEIVVDVNQFVGSKIREYRIKKGMNQTELGKKLGVTQNTISGYENGTWEVGYDTLFKLAEIFEISIDDLFPATKRDDNKVLDRISEVADVSDLTYEDMELIKRIADKLASEDEENRKELFNNIKFALDFFENNK